VAELRARGDDAAARQRLKSWRMTKDAPIGEAWLSQLERSLFRLHEDVNQRRGRGRAHRLPFLHCRQCDALREAAMTSRSLPIIP
jgi:hypothetical protein